MNVYLAARYGRRRQMQGIAAELIRRGHNFTSRWILGVHEASDGNAGPEQQAQWAEEDIEDILASDLLLTVTEEHGTDGACRGGRHVELGFALGTFLPVLMVGPTENIFHHHPRVVQCLSIADALSRIDSMDG